VLCFFGDGAVPEGEFHESLNLAALWKLPVIFVCENNRYAMGTAIHRALSQTEIWRFAETYGIAGEAVDGMDVLAVREAVTEHLRQAREDRRPSLLEVVTYRFRGHSAADPEVYREKAEVKEWQRRDPIESFAARLVEEGVLKEPEVEEIRQAADAIVEEAVEFADASPEPPLESLYENLYVLGEEEPGWYAVDERTPEPHRGELEHEAGEEAQKLAEAGAAYAGQPPPRKRPKEEQKSAPEGAG
jgi:TPP-dependent pyruvate/acetoin dehydrogenase alpha subunit